MNDVLGETEVGFCERVLECFDDVVPLRFIPSNQVIRRKQSLVEDADGSVLVVQLQVQERYENQHQHDDHNDSLDVNLFELRSDFGFSRNEHSIDDSNFILFGFIVSDIGRVTPGLRSNELHDSNQSDDSQHVEDGCHDQFDCWRVLGECVFGNESDVEDHGWCDDDVQNEVEGQEVLLLRYQHEHQVDEEKHQRDDCDDIEHNIVFLASCHDAEVESEKTVSDQQIQYDQVRNRVDYVLRPTHRRQTFSAVVVLFEE